MSDSRYQMDAENAWANQEASSLYRLPTMEPHYTKKDDNLMKYLFERCILYEWGKDENENLIRIAKEIVYQDILDAVYTRLSHLESISYLTSAHAEVEYCKWRLNYHIMVVKYEALGDSDALHLLRELDLTIFNVLWGRAHEGTHQKYDAAVAGARRSMEITDNRNTGNGGFFGRFKR
jgi:hypothetical protein